jgi:SAM-dependent methyltransferase
MKENKNAWEEIYKNNMSYLNYPDSNLVSLFFKNKSNIVSNNKCLDFGCGSGNNAEFLAKYFNDLFAIDISSTAIELTRKRLDKMDSKYNAHFNTKMEGEIMNKNFDFICAWQSLYYNSNLSFIKSLKKLIDSLNKDGIIMFTLLSKEDIKIKHSIQINNFDYKINGSISSQENCTVFAIDSSKHLLQLMSNFKIDIIDYGKFSLYSMKTFGINEYYIIGKKR